MQVFVKSLDADHPEGFAALIDRILSDIYKQASIIKRLAVHKGKLSDNKIYSLLDIFL